MPSECDSGECFMVRVLVAVWGGVWRWFQVRCLPMISVVNCDAVDLCVFWGVFERVCSMLWVCIWVCELPLLPVVYCALWCAVYGMWCAVRCMACGVVVCRSACMRGSWAACVLTCLCA